MRPGLLTALALAALLAASSARAQPMSADHGHPLAGARDAYENADFARTLDALSSLESGTGLDRDDVIALLELRALAEFATGATAALDGTLTRLLSLDPGYAAGASAAPRFSSLVETVRARGILALELGGAATPTATGVRITLRTIDPGGLVRAHRIHWSRDGDEESAEGAELVVPTDQASLSWWAEAIGPGGAVLARTEPTEPTRALPPPSTTASATPLASGQDDSTLAIVLGIVAGAAFLGGAVAVGIVVADSAPADTVLMPAVRW